MKQLKIAFDVDDTLVIPGCVNKSKRDEPNYEVIAVYRFLKAQGHYMIIHSGGGEDYARMWGEKLGLDADDYRAKVEYDGQERNAIDLAFDDCDIEIAKVNVKVKRVSNGIERMCHNSREHEEEECEKNCAEMPDFIALDPLKK